MIERPAERFSPHASAYAANRPSYPAEALDALLRDLGEPSQLRAADIGAGTGIASEQLAERGLHVVAIEPNAAMRTRATANSHIEWRDGTAEATGLPDKSVDIAAAFQAFHWFDPRTAIAEFRRISRRRIALVQYERDEREAFTAAYGELVRRYAIEPVEARRAQSLASFEQLAQPCTRCEFAFAQVLDEERILGRMASTSYLPQNGDEAEKLRGEARALFERCAVDGAVSIAMTCFVLTADA